MNSQHLENLLDFLRFPSVSTDRSQADDVAKCARWLGAKFASMGLRSEVHPTAGQPVVLARNEPRPDRPTVLIYGHYDVQPVDPLELWTHPPFEPHIENGRVYARGSSDNKGQILAHILGVQETLERSGNLPVNLIFLVEGEEEIGSPNLEPFLRAHREELRCDVVAISDSGMVAAGVPTFTYGLRGVAALEFKVTGPSSDLHSGIFGGTVANPATMLARILASLHTEDGRVAIPGFYDDVAPLQPWEREAWTKLPSTDEALRSLTGVPELFGEPGFSAAERIWARPTAEVNGLGGGFQGMGTKTVIPKEAFAKLTFRLVPNQTPDRILSLAREHLQRVCPLGVKIEIEFGHSGPPYLTDPNSAFGKAAQRALAATFGREPALTREGGAIPIVQTFKEVLGVDTLLLGLALPDAHAHAPNENFPLENLEAGIRLNQVLLAELAKR